MIDLEKKKARHKDYLLKTLKEIESRIDEIVENGFNFATSGTKIVIDIDPFALITYEITTSYMAREICGYKND